MQALQVLLLFCAVHNGDFNALQLSPHKDKQNTQRVPAESVVQNVIATTKLASILATAAPKDQADMKIAPTNVASTEKVETAAPTGKPSSILQSNTEVPNTDVPKMTTAATNTPEETTNPPATVTVVSAVNGTSVYPSHYSTENSSYRFQLNATSFYNLSSTINTTSSTSTRNSTVSKGRQIWNFMKKVGHVIVYYVTPFITLTALFAYWYTDGIKS